MSDAKKSNMIKDTNIEEVRKRRRELFTNKTPEKIVNDAIEWFKKHPHKVLERKEENSTISNTNE